MEKKQVSGMYRLVVIFVFFIASMFFLNNQKKYTSLETNIDVLNASTTDSADSSLERAFNNISALLVSHNTDLIVKVINKCMSLFAVDLVEKIVIDASFGFSPEEKMKIIFGTVMHSNGKKKVQYQLLDLLLTYPILYEHTPALLVLLKSDYGDSLITFINWAKNRQKEHNYKNLLPTFAEHAFKAVVYNNDYQLAEHMFNRNIRIPRKSASDMLWDIVTYNRDAKFVSLLMRYGQADINDVRNGKTLLMEAVECDNRQMVQALLDCGAVVDRIVDPRKGSALHIAMTKNYAATEALLREYGA
jgi:hypothetical protein